MTTSNISRINGLLLYLHGYSFYSQRIMLAMHEKNLPYETVTVDLLKDENYEPWYLKINPRGEVPVLKDGVKIIPDSNRILDYVEDNFSNGNWPRLIPVDEGMEVKQKVTYWRELLDKIPANTVTIGCCYHSHLISSPRLPFIAPVRALMKAGDAKRADRLREFADKNPQYRDVLLEKAAKQDENHLLVSNEEKFLQLLDKVNDTFQEVEQQLSSLSDKDWLINERFTAADVYLTVLLERLSQVGLEERFWGGTPPVRPFVNRYYERVKGRASYQTVRPSPWFHVKTLIGVKTLAIAGGVTLLASVAGTIYFVKRSSPA